MDEQSKKAFDFAADLTKQLITLSTSIVTLTLLFSKDVLDPRWLAILIWILFLFSTMFGLLALMALTGTLAPVPQAHAIDTTSPPPPATGVGPQDKPLAIGDNVRMWSKWQVVSFGLAIFLTIFYVVIAMAKHKPTPEQPPCKCEIVLPKQ